MYITYDVGERAEKEKIILLKAFSPTSFPKALKQLLPILLNNHDFISFLPLNCHYGGLKVKTYMVGGFLWGEETSTPKIKQKETFLILQ